MGIRALNGLSDEIRVTGTVDFDRQVEPLDWPGGDDRRRLPTRNHDVSVRQPFNSGEPHSIIFRIPGVPQISQRVQSVCTIARSWKMQNW